MVDIIPVALYKPYMEVCQLPVAFSYSGHGINCRASVWTSTASIAPVTLFVTEILGKSVEERHSHVALFAGILVFFCTMVAIIIWAQNYHQNGEPPLHYFIALSNILSSIGAAFMIPYAIEGIRKKHLYIL